MKVGKIHGLLASIVVLSAITLLWFLGLGPSEEIMTMAHLPKDAIFIEHREDEELAQKIGGVAMQHYASPEALRNGGPIYGILGYRVVSIEYKIPASAIKERTGDLQFEGWKLAIAKSEQLHFDHFHIGPHHDDSPDMGRSTDPVYLIHFMLVPHSFERDFGLICG